MAQKVSLRALKERARVLETHVVRRGYADHEELEQYRPGSEGNPGKNTTWAYIWWLMQLTRFAGREDTLGYGDVNRQHGAADAAVLDALRNEPECLVLPPLEDPLTPDAKKRELFVYPKSLDALMWCHAHDQLLSWLTAKYDVLMRNNTAADLEMMDRCMAEMSYQYRLLVWVVGTKGPGMPDGFERASDHPEPPAWTDLQPFEMLLFAKAHMTVNGDRLRALEYLVAPQKADKKTVQRPSWSVFMGSMAVKMKVQPERLMKDFSLGEVMAAVKLSAPPPIEQKPKKAAS